MTRDALQNHPQYQQWTTTYAGDEYYYGSDAGPVARRAVRYHQAAHHATGSQHGQALDVGCGEGQDLAFLAACGYAATGVDFAETGTTKAQRLLEQRGLHAQVLTRDLCACDWEQWKAQFDLVIAVNSLQFMGTDADACLNRVVGTVAPGGVLGLSLFAREENEENQPAVRSGIFFISLSELLARFNHEGKNRSWQILEAARLWQWNGRTNQPQPFVTLIAQRLKND